jgi:hypothetical protein
VTINFSGSITTGNGPVSQFEILYAGSDGTTSFDAFQPIYNTGTSDRSCPANSTCSLGGSASGFVFSFGNWSPTAYSAYTIVGWYDGGPASGDISGFNVVGNPQVFVVAANGVDLSGTDFATAFPGFNENQISTHILNGWTESGQAFTDGNTFVSHNLSSLPSGSVGGAAAAGTVWDFTTGVQNGSASVQASFDSGVPEPGAAALVLGGLGLLVAAGRRGRQPLQ